jgi:hypothetical protein
MVVGEGVLKVWWWGRGREREEGGTYLGGATGQSEKKKYDGRVSVRCAGQPAAPQATQPRYEVSVARHTRNDHCSESPKGSSYQFFFSSLYPVCRCYVIIYQIRRRFSLFWPQQVLVPAIFPWPDDCSCERISTLCARWLLIGQTQSR